MKLLTPSATCAAILLAISPLMAQSTLHGDASNYSPGPRNVDPGPWQPDPILQNHYVVMAQNNMGSHPNLHSSGLSCAAYRDICSFSGTCSANECPEPKGTRAQVTQERLKLCMVELSTITDLSLRNWCLTQSKRLP